MIFCCKFFVACDMCSTVTVTARCLLQNCPIKFHILHLGSKRSPKIVSELTWQKSDNLVMFPKKSALGLFTKSGWVQEPKLFVGKNKHSHVYVAIFNHVIF